MWYKAKEIFIGGGMMRVISHDEFLGKIKLHKIIIEPWRTIQEGELRVGHVEYTKDGESRRVGSFYQLIRGLKEELGRIDLKRFSVPILLPRIILTEITAIEPPVIYRAVLDVEEDENTSSSPIYKSSLHSYYSPEIRAIPVVVIDTIHPEEELDKFHLKISYFTDGRKRKVIFVMTPLESAECLCSIFDEKDRSLLQFPIAGTHFDDMIFELRGIFECDPPLITSPLLELLFRSFSCLVD